MKILKDSVIIDNKKYTKKQIREAIDRWQKRLDALNESETFDVDGVNIEILTDDDEINNVIEDVKNIVIRTYEPIGGYFGQTDVKRLKKNTSMIKLVKNANGNIIGYSFYRPFTGSHKLQAYGNDGTADGKAAVKAIIKSDIQQYDRWIWGEVSGAVEKYYKKYNGYPLPNEYVAIALRKSPEDITLSPDGFHYERRIGGNDDNTKKVIFGFRNKEIADKVKADAEYEYYRRAFNFNTVSGKKLDEDDTNDKDVSFEYACSFVTQLSDLYDEQNLRQIPDLLYDKLIKSIKTLKNNINYAPWVKREIKNAEWLRDNMSRPIWIENML